ncbi:unnamed protein product [Adineta steineri]|uniref:C-type lectin domain-containing protein n=1 Tax=Adineta steineri TaxID=433720 RepID=A0A818TZY3_9BILA|nr:unnamed protein product [Adineta steineri]
MLRSHFEFACVLYIIFILSVLSVSFNDFCSNDLSCHYPLICSNLSKCICPTSSSSFWNTRQNSCLSCPSGWTEWQHEKCLLFIVPSENNFTYEKAKNSCLTYSSELLHIDNDEDLIKLQYEVDEIDWKFLSDGIWINRRETNLFEWCDTGYEHNRLLWNSCIRLIKKYSDKNNVTSFCLRHTQCNENLPYICERLAKTLEVNNTINNFATIERAWSALIGPIINLAGTLFGSSQQPAPEPQQPEIQIISVSPNPQPQRPSCVYYYFTRFIFTKSDFCVASSDNNFILYISLFHISVAIVIIIIVVVIILFCFYGGGLLYLGTRNKDSVIERRLTRRHHSRPNRTSTDTAASDLSYVSH